MYISLYKDTSFNVGANNVTVDIKVDPDEFSLKEKMKCKDTREKKAQTW